MSSTSAIDAEKHDQTAELALDLATQRQLRIQLQDHAVGVKLLAERQVPSEALDDLRELAHLIDGLQEGATRESTPVEQTNRRRDALGRRLPGILLDSFDQIQWSFRVALAMSVVLFLIGIVLLLVAVWRAMMERGASTATLTIAGLSVADFVLLFYSRPWKDVANNLSNTQQVKVIATFYLAAVTLVERGEFEKLTKLKDVTLSTVSMLSRAHKRERGEGDVELAAGAAVGSTVASDSREDSSQD